MINQRGRKLLFLALPAVLIAGIASVILIETWVRLSWDVKRGTPGFYVSDPVRGQRLAAGYEGWFAGVPVRTNALGFRDDREYTLEKPPGTFRILVLGDSVTFGHGSLQQTTYPFLLEQRLVEWRPDVNWQVWNLGVPGYNTGQELEHLREIGASYRPDLVIVGFYPNDFTNNQVYPNPSLPRRAASAAQRTMQQRLYSYELYKRVFLTLRWRLMTKAEDRLRIEHLSDEAALLGRIDTIAEAEQQKLTPVERITDEEVRTFECIGAGAQTDPTGARELRAAIDARAPEIMPWLNAVREIQKLHRDGRYRMMFFINMAPKICGGQDRFYDSGALADDDLLIEILGAGTPVASSTREFMHRRPSQMPGAGGHAIGNANKVKADVLFAFLRANVLPALLPATPVP